MKKILIVLLLFFINIPFVNAYGIYSYEISSLDLEGTTFKMTGWAKMDAGTCYEKSGNECYTKNTSYGAEEIRTYKDHAAYQSGYGDSRGVTRASVTDDTYGSNKDSAGNKVCTSVKGGVDGTYKYELQIYSVDENGNNPVLTKKIQMDDTNVNKPHIDLTNSVCQKSGNGNCTSASGYQSGCYLDVGIYFEFDLEDLSQYTKFKLKIISGRNSSVTQEFWIGIYSNKYTENVAKYIDTEQIQTKIRIVAYRPNAWGTVGYENAKVFDNGVIDHGDVFTVKATTTINGESWYKIYISSKKTYGWIPASWVDPADPTKMLTLKIDEPPVNEMEDCSVSLDDTDDQSFEVDVCSPLTHTIGDWKNRAYQSITTCNHNTTEYYKSVCNEKIVTNFTPNLGTLKIDSVIDYDITLTGYKGCTYEFDANYWNSQYDYYQDELAKTTNTPARINQINANLDKLYKQIDNYKNFVSYEYDFDPVATIKLSGNAQKSFNFSKDNNTAYNNNIKTQTQNSIINNASTLCTTLKNGSSVCKYQYGTTTDNALKFSGKFTLTNGYILGSSGLQNLSVVVSQLGDKEGWIINGYCSMDIAEKTAIYRPIDDKNPFDFRTNKECNSNWCNAQYNFEKIIDPTIWNETPKYEFHLTNKDIKNIRKSNTLSGVSAYIGKTCTRKANGKYYCSFLRNSSYFSYYRIDDGI